MSLAEYLAKNYLTADNPSNPTTDLSTRPKKKRKKTKTTSEPQEQPTGLIFADDDDDSLRRPSSSFTSSTTRGRNNPDEENPLTVTGPNPGAEFRRAKKSGWKKVGLEDNITEQAEADAILASAAAEARERVQDDEGEDAPAMVSGGEGDGDDDDEAGVKMESGAKAGLQTAAQTAEMVKVMERRKRKEAAKNKEKRKEEGETIYRDASGRVINVAMKRAEARRIADEEAAKEVAAKEALKGDVQVKARERRREELEEAKVMPLARGVDDEDLNEKLKARERWNDPAAEFLTSTSASAGGVSRSLKPVYKGLAPPNRYGIKPGYRWDGVDRGNAFESEWFAARNKKERIGALEYAWQMDE